MRSLWGDEWCKRSVKMGRGASEEEKSSRKEERRGKEKRSAGPNQRRQKEEEGDPVALEGNRVKG
jgi:hypothetical protein